MRKNPRCPICGPDADDPRADRLSGVLRGHAVPSRAAAGADGPGGEITPIELKALIDRGPSRSSWTCATRKRSPSAGSPARRSSRFPSCPTASAELDAAASYVVHCKSGMRSAKAIGLMQAAGFTRLRNLTGGILAWIKDVDPSLPAY